jgi:hypothetical protein
VHTITRHALLNAVATAFYVVIISSFLFYASHTFGRAPTVLIPIAMLLLLVLSAALTGALVLGRPILWYMDGKKKAAVSLLAATLGILLLITLAALALLYIVP